MSTEEGSVIIIRHNELVPAAGIQFDPPVVRRIDVTHWRDALGFSPLGSFFSMSGAFYIPVGSRFQASVGEEVYAINRVGGMSFRAVIVRSRPHPLDAAIACYEFASSGPLYLHDARSLDQWT